MTLPVDLVIFDCDGVLVDSEAISITVLAEAFADLGVALDEAGIYQRYLGRSMLSMQEGLAAEFGFALSPTISPRSAPNCSVATVPISVHRRNRGGCAGSMSIARCVASSSQPDRIRLSLSLTGLLEKFEPHITVRPW